MNFQSIDEYFEGKISAGCRSGQKDQDRHSRNYYSALNKSTFGLLSDMVTYFPTTDFKGLEKEIIDVVTKCLKADYGIKFGYSVPGSVNPLDKSVNVLSDIVDFRDKIVAHMALNEHLKCKRGDAMLGDIIILNNSEDNRYSSDAPPLTRGVILGKPTTGYYNSYYDIQVTHREDRKLHTPFVKKGVSRKSFNILRILPENIEAKYRYVGLIVDRMLFSAASETISKYLSNVESTVLNDAVHNR